MIEAERIEKAFKQLKATLTPREKEVIMKYYGIDKEVRHTLQELGNKYQVTRERIRQIKAGALQKMKIK